MSENKIVKISSGHKERLQKLLSLSSVKYEKAYVENMIDYFYETQLDPTERETSVSDELKKTRDTFISFIRTQEKQKINPMYTLITNIVDYLAEHIPTRAFFEEKTEILRQEQIRLFEERKRETVNLKQDIKKLLQSLEENKKERNNSVQIKKETYKQVQEQINSLIK